VRQLAARHSDVQFVLGDINLAAAESLASEIGSAACAVRVDITERQNLRAVLSGAALVFNAVGPFYKSALPVIDAAIETRVDYMDINDDHDVAAQLVLDPSYHQRATEAGIKILIGFGHGPGLQNVLARLGADRLDRVNAIRLCAIVPFAFRLFSPAVLDHMFHVLGGESTQYLEGQYQKMSGMTGARKVSFLPPFRTYTAHYWGHGEPITVPHFIPGVKEVSGRFAFFPQAGNDLMGRLIDLGFGSRDPVPELGISPLKFLTHYAASEAGGKHFTMNTGEEPFKYANQVEVEGTRNGSRVRMIFEQHGSFGEDEKLLSEGHAAAGHSFDPTPTCARIAIESLLGGELKGTGVLAPEACLDPERYVREVVRETGMALHEREEIIRTDSFRLATEV